MIPKELIKILYEIKNYYPYLYKYSFEELFKEEYEMAQHERYILENEYENVSFSLGIGTLAIKFNWKIYEDDNLTSMYNIDFNNIDFSISDYTDEEILYLKLLGV